MYMLCMYIYIYTYIYIYIYRERERDTYIYIYIHIHTYYSFIDSCIGDLHRGGAEGGVVALVAGACLVGALL